MSKLLILLQESTSIVDNKISNYSKIENLIKTINMG